MPRSRSTVKRTSYTLQVQCDKTPEMNEKEFLELVRKRLNAPTDLPSITRAGQRPTVTVIQRVETFVSVKDDQQ